MTRLTKGGKNCVIATDIRWKHYFVYHVLDLQWYYFLDKPTRIRNTYKFNILITNIDMQIK